MEAYLRTYVPIFWGALVTFLVTNLGEGVSFLGSESVVLGITGLVIAGWYFVWRKVESHLPPWLTRLVLGSNKQPTYTEQHTGQATT